MPAFIRDSLQQHSILNEVRQNHYHKIFYGKDRAFHLLKLLARAKINLTLDILGKRPDGYHEVEMVMQSVALADEVRLEKTAAGVS